MSRSNGHIPGQRYALIEDTGVNLLRFDPDRFHHLSPLGPLGADERAELLGGHGVRLETLIRKTPARIRHGEHRGQSGPDPGKRWLRHPGGDA